jgi:hypothetical protein
MRLTNLYPSLSLALLVSLAGPGTAFAKSNPAPSGTTPISTCPIPTALENLTSVQVLYNDGVYGSPCGGSYLDARVFRTGGYTDFLCWCVDFNDSINPGSTYSFTLIPSGLSGGTTQQYNELNWILNNQSGYTILDVQLAIWELLGYGPYMPSNDTDVLNKFHSLTPSSCGPDTTPVENSLTLLAAAELHPNFIPGPGQVQAVEIDPPSGDQRLIVLISCPALNPGTGTPGYWKNHPNAWPVSSITIGGKTYTVAQAIAIMQIAVAGDKTYNVFDQLVSAELNVLIGNDSSCVSNAISDADAWMALHPVGSGVPASSAAWAAISADFNTLGNYNNGLLCAPARQ